MKQLQKLREIWNRFDRSGNTINVDGEAYQVQFEISGSYKSEVSDGEIKGNTDYKKNYFKVDDGFTGSGMQTKKGTLEPGGNVGYFNPNHLEEGSTTASHEMGHGWGAVHSEKGGDGRGHPEEYSKHSWPRMMLGRGTLLFDRFCLDHP